MSEHLSDQLNLAGYIDHTLLAPLATDREVEVLCLEAIAWGCKAVCIQPKWVTHARSYLEGSAVSLASVLDFPFGACDQAIRLKMAEQLVIDGCEELDFVLPLSLVVQEDWPNLYKELKAILQLAGNRARTKAIIEVSLFSPEQVAEAALVCAQVGVSMVKTSTGIINTRPTSVEDITLLRNTLSDYPEVGIKASGGIKTKEQALKMIEAGATRLGTSATKQILELQ